MRRELLKIERPFVAPEHTESGHYYRTDNGRLYPSVTTLLKTIEPFEKTEGYERFIEWAQKKNQLNRTQAIQWCKDYSKRSTDVGTALHEFAEWHLLDQIDISRYINLEQFETNPKELFEPLKDWLDTNVHTVYAAETPIYSDELRLAGTVDCVARLKNVEKLTHKAATFIVDFKNSRRQKTTKNILDRKYFTQLCAYGKMWEHCTGQKIDYGAVVVVSWDKKLRVFFCELQDYENDLWDHLVRYEALKLGSNKQHT